MALYADFYSFAKRPNSTKVPTQSDAFTTEVVLKKPTDIRNLEMYVVPIEKNGTTYQPYAFNYVYMDEFQRYYFIENWRWDEGRWLCSCMVDVLGTYANTIKASSQYVARSQSSYNSVISDSVYPMLNEYEHHADEITVSAAVRALTYNTENGYYIVGIITQGGTDSSQVSANLGAVTYYLFTPDAFKMFKRALFNDVSWTGIATTTMDNSVLKAFFNPIEYIVSCKWSPFTVLNAYGISSTTTVALGWWTFTISSGAYIFSDTAPLAVTWGFTVASANISKHPQASRGQYLHYEPYSEYQMMLAPYGILKMPSIISEAGFYATETLDMVTGKATLNVYIRQVIAEEGTQTVPYLTAECMMMVDISLAQVRSAGDVTTKLADAGAGLLQSWLEKLPDGAIKNAATGIAGAFRESYTQVSTVGTAGGGFGDLIQFAGFNPTITSKFTKIAEEGAAHFGRPLCATVQLQTLSGYTQCVNADIAIFGTEEEAAEIMQYMNSGFYLE